MRLFLVRHGESTHNKNRICQGQFDSELSDLGREQAKLLAERLKEHNFSFVYSSDLKRAKDTTLSILEHHNYVEPVFDIRLREKSQGIYENRPNDEVPFVDYSENPDFKYPEAESLKDHHRRVRGFLETLDLKDNTLIISHGGTIIQMLSNFLNEPIENVIFKYKTTNTCLYILKKSGDKFEIELENCTKHLE